jgi:hypothetical protein
VRSLTDHTLLVTLTHNQDKNVSDAAVMLATMLDQH